MKRHGILIQGPVEKNTKKIISEYQKLFPNAEILFSTWLNQDVIGITCKVLQIKPPKLSNHFKSNINFQKNAILEGLNKIDCDIVMKCNSDQLIHNNFIFDVYETFCPKDRIMISNYPTLEEIDYFASDFVQIASKKLLLNYWNSIKKFDGTFPSSSEIYLTANHIIREKKDLDPWKICLQKYYFICDYKDEFQIEWFKLSNEQELLDNFNKLYPKCVASSLKQNDHALNKYKDEILYFLHIPKTAGSTLITILDKYFQYDTVLFQHDWPALFSKMPKDFSKYRFVRGHFGYGFHRILPKKPVYITMLRNPSDLIISTLMMFKRQPKDAKRYLIANEPISKIITSSKLEWLKNSQTKWLAFDKNIISLTKGKNLKEINEFLGHEDHQNDQILLKPTKSTTSLTDKKLLEIAKKHLSDFAFVGLVEKMEESLFLLHYTFGWTPILDVMKKNIAPDEKLENITKMAKKTLDQWTELDIKLYNYGKKLFETRYTQMIDDLNDRYYKKQYDNLTANVATYEMLKKHHLTQLEQIMK